MVFRSFTSRDLDKYMPIGRPISMSAMILTNSLIFRCFKLVITMYKARSSAIIVRMITPSFIPRSVVINGRAITVHPKPVMASSVKEQKITIPDSKIEVNIASLVMDKYYPL